jgi:hypothetical protein
MWGRRKTPKVIKKAGSVINCTPTSAMLFAHQRGLDRGLRAWQPGAIPLMKTTSERVDYLYDSMDPAYDAKPIYEVSRSLGHVPIIDKNSRGEEVVPMAPHEAARYRERSVAERFNSRLKEDFGAVNVMVRRAEKVRLHRMFGVIALFANQLLKLIGWAAEEKRGLLPVVREIYTKFPSNK